MIAIIAPSSVYSLHLQKRMRGSFRFTAFVGIMMIMLTVFADSTVAASSEEVLVITTETAEGQQIEATTHEMDDDVSDSVDFYCTYVFT